MEGIPEILPGTNLADEIMKAYHACTETDEYGRSDPIILVVAQKVVSKAEGCLVHLDQVVPSVHARNWAGKHQKDPRIVEIVLQQARRIVKMERGVLIVETHHGYVCANAGVDASNAPCGTVVLLPHDPDMSARRLRLRLQRGLRRLVAVIISDTFGRPWRLGITNVALGVAGISPLLDYRGQVDSYGRSLRATVIAIADELAGAAELVMGKTSGIPVALIEGFAIASAKGTGKHLLRPEGDDLFR